MAQNVKTSKRPNDESGSSFSLHPSSLSTRPGSSTPLQRRILILAGRSRGFDVPELRSLVGGGITKLSKAQASYWIERLSGQALPNPPGKKPPDYKGRAPAGATRKIGPNQIDQITRLMLEYFYDKRDKGFGWLKTNFKVNSVPDLATAKRAGQVIAVLKRMHRRRLNAEL